MGPGRRGGDMARIYVSSTFGDLKDHRDHVYRALRQLGHDVIAMEDYVASDQRPLERCLADVAASDLYVGVFAHRYGYVPDKDNPEGRSITELEYRHAQAMGKPRLVFLLDPDAPWPATSMDAITGAGEGGGRIRVLREELGREHLVSFFATIAELAQKVSVAVTNQLKDQPATGQSTVPSGRGWTIPPPVRSFTGRDDQLAALRTQLTDHGTATLVPTTALTGMGGIGKTQLALAYAQRYRGDYTIGWWIPSETQLGMLTALAELGAAVLGLPEQLPPAKLGARTRDALGDRSGWLLIFDNAPNPAAIAEYLPGAGRGHVLVTSRDSAWHGVADSVPVDLLSAEDAVELLVRRTGDRNRQAAARLAETLGRLPLALEQAAAYASSQRLSLANYLELFEERRAELLTLGRPLAYQGTVDATFTLAQERLQVTNSAAVVLLELCALLAPDEIPLSLLLSDSTLLPGPLVSAAADPLGQGELAGVLYQQGLLTRDTDDTARMHRLVQAVTVAHLPDTDRRQRIAEAVGLLDRLLPDAAWEPDRWPRYAQLLAHLRALLDHARAARLSSPAMASLLRRAGSYLWARSLDIRLAVDMHEQALAMTQRLYQGDHRDVATDLSNLAVDLAALGEHERARELDEQALAMRQRLYPADHPDMAPILSDLAGDPAALRERERALHEQALTMRLRLAERRSAPSD